MKAKEYRERPIEELRHMVEDLRQDVFNLRFQHATGQLDDVSKLRQTKRTLAVVETLIREHELGIRTLTSRPEVS
jgi:large subunit ribosomal protein L29